MSIGKNFREIWGPFLLSLFMAGPFFSHFNFLLVYPAFFFPQDCGLDSETDYANFARTPIVDITPPFQSFLGSCGQAYFVHKNDFPLRRSKLIMHSAKKINGLFSTSKETF